MFDKPNPNGLSFAPRITLTPSQIRRRRNDTDWITSDQSDELSSFTCETKTSLTKSCDMKGKEKILTQETSPKGIKCINRVGMT